MGTFRWYVYFMRQIQISRSVWYLLMVNGSVSNSYGGSILTKYTAKAVCSAAARRTTSSLVLGNSSHSLFLIILREVKTSLDHTELSHSVKFQWCLDIKRTKASPQFPILQFFYYLQNYLCYIMQFWKETFL